MRQRIVIASAVVVLGLAGCQQHKEPEARETGSAAVPTVAPGSATGSAAPAADDPWAAVNKPTPPETPETRKARAEAGAARVTALEPEVAKLRHLSFLKPVPASYQTTDDFRAHVHSELAKEMPAERSREESAKLYHIGLLDKPIDLGSVVENAMVTQAAAYYDPASKRFYLVAVPNDAMLDTFSSHELTHALQDQHFDLTKYVSDYQHVDDDTAAARRFIAEGDATFVMMLYAFHSMAGKDDVTPEMLATIQQQIEKFANQPLDMLKDQIKAQAALMGSLGDDFKKAADAVADIPAVVVVPLLDSYMKGALVAVTAYQQGGWSAVDDLFRHPPESTEQVLHPATKLFPKRELPRHVSLGGGAADKDSNVIGELQWRIYFQLWKAAQPEQAAAGWGGDRYVVSKRKDGRLVGRFATIWDSEADAEKFYAAYVASLPVRFRGADTSHPETGVARTDAGKIFVQRVADKVYIVDGGDDARELDDLIKRAKLN